MEFIIKSIEFILVKLGFIPSDSLVGLVYLISLLTGILIVLIIGKIITLKTIYKIK